MLDPENHNCCFFHSKHAWHDNMVRKKFDDDFIKVFLPLFDFLTIVDRHLIKVGLDFIKVQARKLKGYRAHKSLVEEFIEDYFKPQWLRKKLVPLWNYNTGAGDDGWETKM